MTTATSIEWADYTLNPGIYGCSKASEACQHCYAMGMAHRLTAMGVYPEGITRSTSHGPEWTGRVLVDYEAIGPAFAKLPKRKPARVFVTSMADVFHADVPFDFVLRAFEEMESRPHLTFLVLTKRPERMAEYARRTDVLGGWPRNVWAGCTVENQARADERIPHLLRVPAPVRFLSVEPMLGPVDLGRWLSCAEPACAASGLCNGERGPCGAGVSGINWVIAGGESGARARPSHPEWFRSLRDQCVAAGVPFLFKQWGEWAPGSWAAPARSQGSQAMAADGRHKTCTEAFDPVAGDALVLRIGKAAAGREIDGRTWDEVPPLMGHRIRAQGEPMQSERREPDKLNKYGLLDR
jgi:protein gp37